MKRILLNLALFQVGWAVCVLGGSLFAVAYTLPALALHAWLVLRDRVEWKLIGAVVAVGCLWDLTMANTGIIDFAEDGILGIPLWLVCLWALFATTFMHCLFWLNRHLWLASVLAGIFGPATYWIGTSLTGASLGEPAILSLAIMGAGWAVLFPCGIYYARKLDDEQDETLRGRDDMARPGAAVADD